MAISELRTVNGEWNENQTPRAIRHSPLAAAVVTAARGWIGTPYAHQASLRGVGCDCLGLLRGVWRELYGEDAATPPPYSPDWAEATGEETLYAAMKRHLTEIDPRAIAPGDIALFRMMPHGPAKHCGIVASQITSPLWGGRQILSAAKDFRVGDHGGCGHRPPPGSLRSPTSPQGGGDVLTLIHARQNKQVSEEMFGAAWGRKLTAGFRL